MAGVLDACSRRLVGWAADAAKSELILDHVFATRAAAKSALFDCIEVFYNRRRLQGRPRLPIACGLRKQPELKHQRTRTPRCPRFRGKITNAGRQRQAPRRSRTPHERWRKAIPLTEEQRAFNHTLASERVLVENVIHRLKVFRVLEETYRHRRRRHGLRLHLLAGLYNHDLLLAK